MASYELKHPIKGAGGGETKTIHIREPIKVADMMHVAQECPNANLEGYYLVARMCGLQMIEVEQLELGDFVEINAIVRGKMPGVAP